MRAVLPGAEGGRAASLSGNGPAVAVPRSATLKLDVHNPNILGFSVEPGNLSVKILGRLVATGTTADFHVRPKSSAVVRTSIDFAFGDGVHQWLSKAVLASRFQLAVSLRFSTRASVGVVAMKVIVKCLLSFNVLGAAGLVDELLLGKVCSYDFRI